MFEIYFFVGAILVLNLYTHDQINKDGAYFLDDEKPSYISMVWYLPMIGAILALYRLHADKEFYFKVMAIYLFFRFSFYYVLFELF